VANGTVRVVDGNMFAGKNRMAEFELRRLAIK